MEFPSKFETVRFWLVRILIATFLSFAIGFIPPSEFSAYPIALSFLLEVIGIYFQWRFIVEKKWKSEFIYSILAFPWWTIWILYLVWINTLNIPLLAILVMLNIWAVLIPVVQPKVSKRLYVFSLSVNDKPAILAFLFLMLVAGISVLSSRYVQKNVIAWLPVIFLFSLRFWSIQLYVHVTWLNRRTTSF